MNDGQMTSFLVRIFMWGAVQSAAAGLLTRVNLLQWEPEY